MVEIQALNPPKSPFAALLSTSTIRKKTTPPVRPNPLHRSTGPKNPFGPAVRGGWTRAGPGGFFPWRFGFGARSACSIGACKSRRLWRRRPGGILVCCCFCFVCVLLVFCGVVFLSCVVSLLFFSELVQIRFGVGTTASQWQPQLFELTPIETLVRHFAHRRNPRGKFSRVTVARLRDFGT